MSGVNPFTFWASYLILDGLYVTVFAGVAVLIFFFAQERYLFTMHGGSGTRNTIKYYYSNISASTILNHAHVHMYLRVYKIFIAKKCCNISVALFLIFLLGGFAVVCFGYFFSQVVNDAASSFVWLNMLHLLAGNHHA